MSSVRRNKRGPISKKELRRNIGSRGDDKDLILIVCEGVKTERNYFESFHLTNVKVIGEGAEPLAVVKAAQARVEKDKKMGKIYDQVWCVFDRDDHPIDRFNTAVQLINSTPRFKLAYTNEAFELWYLLHFTYLNTGISRDDYKGKLTQYLEKEYKKNDPDIYNLLLEKGNQNLAIRYAEKLYTSEHYENPAQTNPSTTVHKLVLELKKYQTM